MGSYTHEETLPMRKPNRPSLLEQLQKMLGRSRVTLRLPILGEVEIDAPGLVAITVIIVVGLVLLAPTALKAFELVVARL
jgi:hypothetical protein